MIYNRTYKFTREYLKQSRVDRKKNDNTTLYDAIINGHTSQYGTTWTEGDKTPGYLSLAMNYEIDDNKKEWLKLLIIQISANADWEINEDRIPTNLLNKRPIPVNDFENGIHPKVWLEQINNIWRKT